MTGHYGADEASWARRTYRRARHRFQHLVKRLDRRLRQRAICDEYGTHLPLLEVICRLHPPRLTLEFGMGLNSTGFLLDQSELLVSVEHNATWYRRVVQRLPRKACVFAPILWRDEHVEDILDLLASQHFDLALVDGPGASRVQCALALLARAGFVVVHDTEAACYGWTPLFTSARRDGVHFYTDRRAIPWTSVFSSDLESLRNVVKLVQGDDADIDRLFPAVR